MDNAVTTDDKTDKIYSLETTRSVDQEFVLNRILSKNPGLHREAVGASINLYHEALSELVMNGYSVNTDLFRMVPQIKGLASPAAGTRRRTPSTSPSPRARSCARRFRTPP